MATRATALRPEPALAGDAGARRLESEGLVRLPVSASAPVPPFVLQGDEAALLSLDSASLRAKSASYDGHAVRGLAANASGETARTIEVLLSRFGAWAREAVLAVAPGYGEALTRGRSSLRLRDAAEAPLSPLKDDRRLHVDAFASQPTGGRRILRVFSNINPSGEPRLWRTGEAFEDHARRFLPRVRWPLPGEARLLRALRITRSRRTPYDALMLGLHDAAKTDAVYQRHATGTDLAFAAGESWIVFTDSVVHAALKGRFALEQTFYLPVAAMAEPERAPLRVLERLAGRPLA